MASAVNGGSAVVVDVATGSGTATGLTFAAGSNRALGALVIHEQTNNARPIPSLSVDSKSFTKIHGHVYGASSTWVYCEFWAANESTVGTLGTNPAVALGTPSGGNANASVIIFTITDANQTLASWTNISQDGDTAANAMSAALAGFTSGSAIVGCAGDSTGGFSIATNTGDAVTEFTGSDRAYPSGTRSVGFYGTAGSTAPTVGADSGSTSGTVYQTMILVGIPDAASGPTISSVDSTPEHLNSEAFTGTGFPTSQTGSAAVKFVGAIQTVTLTPTYNTATALSAVFDVGNNKFGVAGTVTVTDASGNVSSGYAVTPQPRTGGAVVDLSTLATAGDRLEAIPDLQSGYQVEYYGGVGCTCGTDLIVFNDATVQYPPGATGFYARAHNGTSWGAAAFISITDFVAARRGYVRDAARSPVRPAVMDQAN